MPGGGLTLRSCRMLVLQDIGEMFSPCQSTFARSRPLFSEEQK
jgi:hypothetical protein